MQDRDPVSNGALVRPCGGPVPSAPPGWSWESLMRLALDEARQAEVLYRWMMSSVKDAEGILARKFGNLP